MSREAWWVVFSCTAVIGSLVAGLFLVSRYARTRRRTYLVVGLPLSLIVPGLLLVGLLGTTWRPFQVSGHVLKVPCLCNPGEPIPEDVIPKLQIRYAP
jgi:hypothetical protein